MALINLMNSSSRYNMSIFSNFKSNEYINVVNMISDTKIITKGPYKMNFYNDINESIL